MLFLMTCKDFEMSEIRFCKVNLFKLSVLCAIVDIKLKNKTYCFLSVRLSTNHKSLYTQLLHFKRQLMHACLDMEIHISILMSD